MMGLGCEEMQERGSKIGVGGEEVPGRATCTVEMFS